MKIQIWNDPKGGFYIVFGLEVLAGPYKTLKEAEKARGEWYNPEEGIDAFLRNLYNPL